MRGKTIVIENPSPTLIAKLEQMCQEKEIRRKQLKEDFKNGKFNFNE